MKTKEDLAEECADRLYKEYRDRLERGSVRVEDPAYDGYLAGFEAGVEARGGVVLSREALEEIHSAFRQALGSKTHPAWVMEAYDNLVKAVSDSYSLSNLDKRGEEP